MNLKGWTWKMSRSFHAGAVASVDADSVTYDQIVCTYGWTDDSNTIPCSQNSRSIHRDDEKTKGFDRNCV